MRVLWLSELYPTRQDPGRAAYLWPLLAGLRRRMDVTLVLLEEPGLEPDFSGLGSPDPLVRLPLPGMRTWRRVWIQTLLARGVPGRLRDLKPDLVHAQFGAPSGVLASRAGLPFLVTLRGTDANVYLDSPVLGGMIRGALSHARRVLAVSTSVAETLARHGLSPERVTVLENGVDTEAFHPRDKAACRVALGLPPEGPLLLFVGHLLEAKGLEDLARALPEVLKVHPMLQVALVGGGADPGPWKARFSFLGDRVRFAGPRPASEMPLWMGAADLFCLPSHAEGRPNTALEAVASGRPVVAASVGALPHIVDVSCGALVPPRDPSALGRALVETLGRSWDAQAIAARSAGWSWEKTADRLVQIYGEALA